jgi:oligosaccharide repeat unit polymerase
MEYIMEFGYEQLRGADQEALGQSSFAAHALQWLCLPLFNVTMIISAIGLATKQKKMKPTIVLAIIDATIYAVIYGGRYIVVKFIFFIVSAFVISEKGRIKYLFKNHKKVIIFAIFGVWLLNYLTSLRSVSGMGFIGNLVVYFSGSFTFLSELLSKNVHGSYMGFGRITFGFMLNFISVIGTFVFGMPYKGTDALVTSFVGDYLTIGQGITYNALPTVLYYFILDFGKVFWVIGIIILSAFSHKVEDKFYQKKDWNYFCKYLFVLFTLFDTVLVYDYLGIGTLMSFLLIELFTSDKCKIEKIGW